MESSVESWIGVLCITLSLILCGKGFTNTALYSATSCSALWIFFTPFGRRKSYVKALYPLSFLFLAVGFVSSFRATKPYARN